VSVVSISPVDAVFSGRGEADGRDWEALLSRAPVSEGCGLFGGGRGFISDQQGRDKLGIASAAKSPICYK
jgi:hypothetical protein